MRSRPLLAWVGVLIAVGGVFLFSKSTTVVSLRNLHDRGAAYFKWTPSEQVTLFYINSMYNAPVEEVFAIEEKNIVLKAVRSSSPSVMEYYGFESSAPVQSMNRSLGPAFSIQISMRQDQGLTIGERTVDLHAMGNPGDHVQVRVEEVSLASVLLSRMFRRHGADAPIRKP